jgi:hypothetical protein
MRGLFLSAMILVGNAALAQPPGSSVITGKVTAVSSKGKTTTLKVQDGAGTEHTLEVAPKTAVEIQSDGDDECLAPGLFVQIDTIQSNKNYFGSEFRVISDYAGKIPAAKAVKAPAMIGQSTERHFVSGEIARFEKVEDGKYNLLHLKSGPKTEMSVYIEPNHKVKVVQTEAKAAKVGQTATVEGRTAGTKFLPAKITIDTGEKITAEDFVGQRKKK